MGKRWLNLILRRKLASHYHSCLGTEPPWAAFLTWQQASVSNFTPAEACSQPCVQSYLRGEGPAKQKGQPGSLAGVTARLCEGRDGQGVSFLAGRASLAWACFLQLHDLGQKGTTGPQQLLCRETKDTVAGSACPLLPHPFFPPASPSACSPANLFCLGVFMISHMYKLTVNSGQFGQFSSCLVCLPPAIPRNSIR